MYVNNLIKKRRVTCKKLMQAHSLAQILAAPPHMPLVKEKHHINAWGQKGVKNVITSKESK